MMKKVTGIVLLLFFSYMLWAQVSHGGQPLPFIQLRNASDNLFEDMPAFDVKEELRLDSMNAGDLRGGYKFAYKFMTHFNRGNSGVSYTLADGTRVWRLGIRSKGALSVNILFTEYELPEGAQVFIFNPQQTKVLGSFTSQNNSELNILPVSPLEGDELIVEYHEPAHAAFPGRLTVGEVNHGYRSLMRGLEPGERSAGDYSCTLSPVCLMDQAEYGIMARSTVLLIIDGESACTGVMLNNTSENGKPYLLTAIHCLNRQFQISNPDYESIAGKIICYFNYDSPTCDPVMQGTKEMSVVSSSLKVVNEEHDMALLELLETPPAYYQPYYAGWNIQEDGGTPLYTGIHHPRASVKRMNIFADNVALQSFTPSGTPFVGNVHWYLKRWDTGTTDSGSSGSPLFDSNLRVIGALSGGESTCSKPVNDYYFALMKSWEPLDDGTKQLKYWLDPANSNALSIDGLDPHKDNPCYRLSNVYEAKMHDQVEITQLPPPANGNLFGINSNGTTEYAEEYYVSKKAHLYGVYIVIPSASRGLPIDVEAMVYDGNGKPQRVLHSEKFYPTYTNLNGSTVQETQRRSDRDQGVFVPFSAKVSVTGSFYVGYRIKSSSNDSFAVYNIPKGLITKNTTWINKDNVWTTASNQASLNTSLFIDPVIQYASEGNSNEKIKPEEQPVLISKGEKTIHIWLKQEGRNAFCSIYTSSGTLVKKTSLSESNTTIPVSDYSPGVYLINVTGENLFYTQKIIF